MDLAPKSIQRLKRSAPFVFGLTTEKVRTLLVFLTTVLAPLEKDLPQKKGTVVSNTLGKIIMAHPYVLNLSIETNLKPRIDFLTQVCQMNATHIAKVIQTSNGSILGLSVQQNLKPKINFLWHFVFQNGGHNPKGGQSDYDNDNVALNQGTATLDQEQINRNQLRKCIVDHPALLGLSQMNLQSKVDFFNSIGPTIAYRIAVKCPTVYSTSLHHNILPTIEFLSNVWGIPTTNLSTTTTLTSPIVATTIPSNNSKWSTVPTLASASASTAPTVNISDQQSQSSIVFSTPNKKLEQMLYEYPEILTLSLEGNLRPTMNFFNRTGYTYLDDVWRLRPSAVIYHDNEVRTETVAQDRETGIDVPAVTDTAISKSQFTEQHRGRKRKSHQSAHQSLSTIRPIRGRYIAASLYNRLLPRWHFFLSATTTAAAAATQTIASNSTRRTVIPLTSSDRVVPIPPLDILVMASDKAYCEKLGYHPVEYEQFKQDAIPRLKFSSQFDTWLKTGRPIDL
jgi:hypothetical protein